MRLGIPYDSDKGRSICGAITAIMTGEAYATSAEMASELGPFPAFAENRASMLRIIKNHRRAAFNARYAHTSFGMCRPDRLRCMSTSCIGMQQF